MKRALVLALAACGPKLSTPGVIPGRTDPAAVHVDGSAFRDGQGRQLLFRGYNAKVNGIFDATFDDGRAPNEVFPDFDEASAQKFEELGFDAMRLTINWSALEPRPQKYSEAFFSKVDAVLDMAHRHHFYVILDMHQDAYSKEIGEDGAPLWAIVPPPQTLLSGPSDDSRRTSPEVLQAGIDFFANAQATDGRPLQQAFITAVSTMAKRYTFDAAVLGFEAFNEPVVFHQDQLDAFHASFADTLHAIDRDAPILFEPISTRNQFDQAEIPSAPFVHGAGVYAVHVYTGWFSQVTGWQNDPSVLAPSMQHAVAEAAAWGTPLFVTEFGCDQSGADGATWLKDELDLQDRVLASSTTWTWEPGAWGIRHDDASNAILYWPATIAAVSRPYPRAVAGDLISIERPSPDRMVVHWRTNPKTISQTHEVSASPDYFSDYSIFCDGSPASDVVRSLGRATFTCPASPGDHTFEVRGTLVSP
ncbi:MAG TPA: cellulase family glycosylhydrolase [Polyangiaceae bacterium]|jgi:endoglycosylceramidase